jgi:hypothetical protein
MDGRFFKYMFAAVLYACGPNSWAVAAPQCSSVPSDEAAASAQLDLAWGKKKSALIEELTSLRNVRRELELSADDTSDAGVLKASLLMAAKTTSNLITDLAPFGSEIRSTVYSATTGSAQVMDAIKDYQNSSKTFWIDTGLSLGAELNPTLRALNALNNFGRNISDMRKLPEDVARARREYQERLADLAQKVEAALTKLDLMMKERKEDFVQRLLSRSKSLRNRCEEVNNSCVKDVTVFIKLMCWGGMASDHAKCEADAHAQFKC